MAVIESITRIKLLIPSLIIALLAIAGCADTYKWYTTDVSEFLINTWNDTRKERGNVGDKSNPGDGGVKLLRDTVKAYFKEDLGKVKEYYFKIVIPKDGEKNSYALSKRVVPSTEPDVPTYAGSTGTLTQYEADGSGGTLLPENPDPVIKAIPGDTLKFKYTPPNSFYDKGSTASSFVLAIKIVPLELDGELDPEKVMSTENRIELTVIKNIPPVAVLAPLKADPAKGHRTYIFDGSGSNDQAGPKRFWGQVKTYTYTITTTTADGTVIRYTFPDAKAVSNWTFPSAGDFTITLVVNDDDGGASDPKKDKQATQQLHI